MRYEHSSVISSCSVLSFFLETPPFAFIVYSNIWYIFNNIGNNINYSLLIHNPSMKKQSGSVIYSFLDQLDPVDLLLAVFFYSSHSAVFQCNKGFCQPTSWNALITLVQLPREPVWYSILLFPIPPISFTLDTWHLHNGLALSPI